MILAEGEVSYQGWRFEFQIVQEAAHYAGTAGARHCFVPGKLIDFVDILAGDNRLLENQIFLHNLLEELTVYKKYSRNFIPSHWCLPERIISHFLLVE